MLVSNEGWLNRGGRTTWRNCCAVALFTVPFIKSRQEFRMGFILACLPACLRLGTRRKKSVHCSIRNAAPWVFARDPASASASEKSGKLIVVWHGRELTFGRIKAHSVCLSQWEFYFSSIVGRLFVPDMFFYLYRALCRRGPTAGEEVIFGWLMICWLGIN